MKKKKKDVENMNSMENYREQQLASYWGMQFKNSMIYKAEYIKKWLTYFDAYRGDYFKNDKLPEYRSNMVSNYIFSVVETIRPIMLDNDPRFQALGRHPEAVAYSSDLQNALNFEWDRERMSEKLFKELINTLVIGNSVFFVKWNSYKKCVETVPINPFNIFPDPLATSVEDSEYIIYGAYYNVEMLKRMYPKKADKLSGGAVNYSELVYENGQNSKVDNQVLVLEVWTRDYECEEVYEDKIKTTKSVYPEGRVITLCPELGVVLDDKKNPYKDGRFPFVVLKDYDIPGKFWGEGEVAQLLSPQKYMNDLNNAIIDNAKATANMPWIIDKNSGIKQGTITGRPGAIIRKNPGSEVKRDQAPSMPTYVINAVETYKGDIQMISGVHNTLMGENSSGVYTAQGILALQEAGHIRIRLKVKLMEETLGQIATLWVNRMRQFWKEKEFITISKADGTYDLKAIGKELFKYDYDVKITAGSTMPVNRGAMLDLMIRLAQTPMPDGSNLVDREAVAQYLPQEIKSTLLERMKGENATIQQLQQTIQEIGQSVQESSQMLQQVAQENQQVDDEQFKLLEEVMGAVEKLNNQILQLDEKYVNMEEEKKTKENEEKLKDDAYNSGYLDAEKLYQQQDKELPEATGDVTGLPEEILMGLESMSDDELAVMLEKYPQLIDMIE